MADEKKDAKKPEEKKAEPKKLDDKLIQDAYDSYSRYIKYIPQITQATRESNELARKKAKLEDRLNKFQKADPKDSYLKDIKSEIEVVEREMLYPKHALDTAKKHKASLESYFKAGGRAQIVDEYMKDLQGRILSSILDEKTDGNKDSDKYKEVEKQYKELLDKAAKDIKENKDYNTAYLALTSPGLKDTDMLIAKAGEAVMAYQTLVDRALGGDGKGTKFNYYANSIADLKQMQMQQRMAGAEA